jgi:hypothetical protein
MHRYWRSKPGKKSLVSVARVRKIQSRSLPGFTSERAELLQDRPHRLENSQCEIKKSRRLNYVAKLDSAPRSRRVGNYTQQPGDGHPIHILLLAGGNPSHHLCHAGEQ